MADEQQVQVNAEGTETQIQTETTETKAEAVETVEAEINQETPEEDGETVAAQQLYRALKDPDHAVEIIELLAKKAGLITTREEKKEAKNLIHEALVEGLGEDYKWLADKLNPAINKILTAQQKQLEEKFDAQEARERQKESNDAVEKITGKFEDFKDHSKRIYQLMEEVVPSGKLSQEQYLTKLYKLAKAEASEEKKSSDKQQRSDKSRNDVPGRLRQTSVGEQDRSDLSRPISRREAIAEALEELSSKT